MQSFLRKTLDTLTPNSSSTSVPRLSSGTDFFVAPDEKSLFPVVDPAVDGEDCDHDCESCTIHYPAKFSIDEDDKLYGHVKGWSTHLIVATGKTDWVRSVEDEKGSVMEAVGKAHDPENGRLMLSASNMPVPDTHSSAPSGQQPTTVLLLPSFTVLNDITPADVPKLISTVISHSPTNTTRYPTSDLSLPTTTGTIEAADPTLPPASLAPAPPTLPASIPFPNHQSPHIALILLCSQKTRDARCGQSAPLLRREFERHLRPLGLYRDLHDERPGGVGIYFISHVGGHKYSANCMVYRRGAKHFEKFNLPENNGANANTNGHAQQATNGTTKTVEATEQKDDGAAQCIWLARVRPEDCEGIVKFTILKGKVVKPERQLRGGFDREREIVSW